jgi:hypothetical protein
MNRGAVQAEDLSDRFKQRGRLTSCRARPIVPSVTDALNRLSTDIGQHGLKALPLSYYQGKIAS